MTRIALRADVKARLSADSSVKLRRV